LIPSKSNGLPEEFLHSQIYFGFCRIPKCIVLLESIFRGITNRSSSEMNYFSKIPKIPGTIYLFLEEKGQ